MEYIGFDVTKEEYKAKSDALLEAFDKAVTDPTKVTLQAILTWDEFATLAPALLKASKDEDKWGVLPAFSPYATAGIELPPPEKDLSHVGVYKGVTLYVKQRPVAPKYSRTVAPQ